MLSSIVLASLNTARAKARDARRVSDMNQIALALELYYDDHNKNYPYSNSGNGGWEDSAEDNGVFLESLVSGGYLPSYIVDPLNTYASSLYYSYYLYPAGYSGCTSSSGQYYVLGIRNMETSGRPHPQSPGWSCPLRDWKTEFDWVMGKFEH